MRLTRDRRFWANLKLSHLTLPPVKVDVKREIQSDYAVPGALLKCRQFKKWLRKILDNYQNVDILETCLDSPKFCWLWKRRHLVVGKFQNLDILKILVECNSLNLFILIVSINPKSSLRCDAFMCHKPSSPRRVNRFAWNFGGIYNSTRTIAWGTFLLPVGTS